MMLLEIVRSRRGVAAELALAANLSRPFIWQCATGERKLPLDRCPAIERATQGKVLCEQLRPDITWHRVPDPSWPHADGRPCIDVAAPEKQAA